MFKKLRWKFMLVSTVILLLVITAVMGTVCLIASGTIMSQSRFLMEEILDNEGNLPVQGRFDPQTRPFLALNEESIYEVRYFTAQVEKGEARISNINIIMREDDAVSIAESVCRKSNEFGSLFISGNRRMSYLKQVQEDESVLVVLLDITSRYSLIRMVMTYMSALWFAVLILYIVIMGRYSEKLVQPFIENDEKQKRFITNASHELKTPLAVISANTEMTEALSGKSKWTESTWRQIGKLQSLIEDLVVMARLDEMKEAALTETDLSALTAETVGSFCDVIETSGRHLHTDIAQNLCARSEKRSYQQLVSILMDNAVKYCDEGGTIEVILSGKPRSKSAKLTVSNTYAEGRNLDYSRFFERFYREDASHNSAKAGFGIGLSMGKEIAERMEGKLTVRYAGEMISFVFEL